MREITDSAILESSNKLPASKTEHVSTSLNSVYNSKIAEFDSKRLELNQNNENLKEESNIVTQKLQQLEKENNQILTQSDVYKSQIQAAKDRIADLEKSMPQLFESRDSDKESLKNVSSSQNGLVVKHSLTYLLTYINDILKEFSINISESEKDGKNSISNIDKQSSLNQKVLNAIAILKSTVHTLSIKIVSSSSKTKEICSNIEKGLALNIQQLSSIKECKQNSSELNEKILENISQVEALQAQSIQCIDQLDMSPAKDQAKVENSALVTIQNRIEQIANIEDQMKSKINLMVGQMEQLKTHISTTNSTQINTTELTRSLKTEETLHNSQQQLNLLNQLNSLVSQHASSLKTHSEKHTLMIKQMANQSSIIDTTQLQTIIQDLTTANLNIKLLEQETTFTLQSSSTHQKSSQITQIESALSNIVTTLNKSLESVKSNVNSLKTVKTDLDTTIMDQNNEITNLSLELNTQLQFESTLIQEIEFLKNNKNSLQEKITSLKLDFSKLEGKREIYTEQKTTISETITEQNVLLKQLEETLLKETLEFECMSVTSQENFFSKYSENLESLTLAQKSNLLTMLITLNDKTLFSMGVRQNCVNNLIPSQNFVKDDERKSINQFIFEHLKDIILGELEMDKSLMEELESRFDSLMT